MKKKLLIVTTVPETVNSILNEQPKFLNQFLDVSIVTSPTKGFNIIGTEEDLPTHGIPMQRGISVFKDFYSLLKMILLLLKLKPDIIHSYTPKAGLIAMLASRICFVPVRIHTFTGLIFPTQKGLKKSILIFFDRLICICASRVVPEGEGVKRDLVKHSITSKPLNIIGHGNIAGIDTDFFSTSAPDVCKRADQLRKKLNIPPIKFIFSFIGRLNKDKGIAELEAAFRDMPDHVHLIIAGNLDSNSPLSAELYGKLELNRRIHLLGFLEDIRPVLAISNVLILPSYREGFPNVILQASSMEIPVIATDINGSNEVIKDKCNGWLVQPRDTDELKEVMLNVLSLPVSQLTKMGRENRQAIKAKYERKEYWLKLKEFYFAELRL